ncbi:hypothetical protein VNO78_06804 [Psophocarpus tetragonolobus]|uniref:Uncharacterized protein n=1 Tax=Psophocarpus tetragonolobus TaxID=3891 RepID=A0AAN9XRC9_PSOTE
MVKDMFIPKKRNQLSNGLMSVNFDGHVDRERLRHGIDEEGRVAHMLLEKQMHESTLGHLTLGYVVEQEKAEQMRENLHGEMQDNQEYLYTRFVSTEDHHMMRSEEVQM